MAHQRQTNGSGAELGPPAPHDQQPAPRPRTKDPMSIANIMSSDTESVVKRQSAPRTGTPARPKSPRIPPKQPEYLSTNPDLAHSDRTDMKSKAKAPTPVGTRLQPLWSEIDQEAALIDEAELAPREDDPVLARAKEEYFESCRKRMAEVAEDEALKRKRRRTAFIDRYHEPLNNFSAFSRARYFKAHQKSAWDVVQQQEVLEDKERKKDMQRKRRREKTLANEQQKREEAYEKAQNTEDAVERARLLREVEKHEKKLRSATRLLNGPSPTQDGFTTEGTFHILSEDASIDTPFTTDGGKRGLKSRGGKARPRKSKAQKQAEKDAAAAGQAALDRGEELPPAPAKTPRTPATEKKASLLSHTSAAVSPSGRKKPGPKPKALREALAAAAAAAAAAGEDPPDMSVIEIQAAAAIQEAADKKKEAKEAREANKAAAKLKKEAEKAGKQPYSSKAYNNIYDHIWKDIARRDIPKVYRVKETSTSTRSANLRKTAQLASKEARRWQIKTNKSTKDTQARAKRSMREMLTFWKRNEKDERDQRKLAEKMELENAKRLEAEREANRQKRKLNFLISQTELYSHFIGKKVRTEELEQSAGTEADKSILQNDKVKLPQIKNGNVGAKVTNFEDLDFDNEDESALQTAAMANAQSAIKEAQDRARQFNQETPDDEDDGEMNFQNPTSLQNMNVSQPRLLNCQLKEYQIKGLNWLVNLYEQGINGILADEMGLGKTVQSISVMAYLAEVHNIWGPFLVVAPASTLHNWQQEISKFVPDFKALPYWGTAKDRKVLRKFWDRKHITYTKDSPFHVLITSYQMVVQDAQYFQKMRWQYMILDEAQAIKSSQSSRWKALLSFHCRNRLLLTGTPIQNNMQELWALLHFIMPSLFDSHDEFSDWFSKDIESHAQSNTKLNEDQLRRLHMILKPFMLRRIKKHVQKELGDKVELDVFCDLTYRQRGYYNNLRNKISIMDILERVSTGSEQDSATLMNLVMQFRKVCNHPDLFERSTTVSPLSLSYYGETASFLREGNTIDVDYSVKSLISLPLPRLVYTQSGLLNVPTPQNRQAGWRKRNLDRLMNIWVEDYVEDNSIRGGAFSFLRFVDCSSQEACRSARDDLITRAIRLKSDERKSQRLSRISAMYNGEENDKRSTLHTMFNIVDSSPVLANAEISDSSRMRTLLSISENVFERSGLEVIEPCAAPPAWAPPPYVQVSSHDAMQKQQSMLTEPSIVEALHTTTLEEDMNYIFENVDISKLPITGLLPKPNNCRSGYTHIKVPSMQKFVSDAGKLACLDRLLKDLKQNGHRVLLYFQMTRMIDMMEEYLTYRGYKYCRLDGSTKMEDRRDTVSDFQSNPEIFVFLLSTRAGGLGINLTSADTVIFYDSDWNPTIDSQAMDRAHRLGQTKQVTVYRLITRNSIEERIRKRALQKEEVQRVVITGRAGSGIDFNGRNRENRAKDMALWLANDDEAQLIEQREREREAQEAVEKNSPTAVQTGRKKRGATARQAKQSSALSLEDMYHEGEGHFDDESSRQSGTGTPAGGGDDEPAAAATTTTTTKGRRKAAGGGGGSAATRRTKAMKQRLAAADGRV